MEFKLHSDYQPTGDQPQAIEKLVKGFREGNQFQTLVGVTGSGKTFTMANVIEKLQKPTLIISHNKTLAAQLYSEMKEFFPENAVEYFVSPRTPISRRIPPSTTRSTSSGTPPPAPFWSGRTSSWWPVSPASTAWAARWTIRR